MTKNETEKDDRSERWAKRLSGVTCFLGSFPAIIGAVGMVVLWAMSGPLFKFSDTWQLLINTPTTVITFWMAFIIQNTQNRDGRAIQTKLDAIMEAMEGMDDTLVGLENHSERVIQSAQKDIHKT